jgi:hypothetical protein
MNANEGEETNGRIVVSACKRPLGGRHDNSRSADDVARPVNRPRRHGPDVEAAGQAGRSAGVNGRRCIHSDEEFEILISDDDEIEQDYYSREGGSEE